MRRLQTGDPKQSSVPASTHPCCDTSLFIFHREAKSPPQCVLYWIVALFSLESEQGTLGELTSAIQNKQVFGVGSLPRYITQSPLSVTWTLWFLSSVVSGLFSEVSLIHEDCSTVQNAAGRLLISVLELTKSPRFLTLLALSEETATALHTENAGFGSIHPTWVLMLSGNGDGHPWSLLPPLY